MIRIVVSCMDRRLNKYLDEKYNDSNTIFVRNAGCNIESILGTLRSIISNEDVKDIILVPHNDCGAMKYVYGALKENKPTEKEWHASLIREFEKIPFSSADELDVKNYALQQESAEKYFSKSVKLISTENATVEKSVGTGKHILVIAKAGRSKYGEIADQINANSKGEEKIELSECYFIQANGYDEISPDITIAVRKLGITDIVIYSNGTDEDRQMLEIKKKMKIHYSDQGLNIEIVSNRHRMQHPVKAL